MAFVEGDDKHMRTSDQQIVIFNNFESLYKHTVSFYKKIKSVKAIEIFVENFLFKKIYLILLINYTLN